MFIFTVTPTDLPLFDTLLRLAQGIGTLFAIIVSMRALRRDNAATVAAIVLADEKFQERQRTFREELLTIIRDTTTTSVNDRWQRFINERYFMSSEVQNAKNGEFDRRLEVLERKIDDTPARTADAVMLRLRESGQNRG